MNSRVAPSIGSMASVMLLALATASCADPANESLPVAQSNPPRDARPSEPSGTPRGIRRDIVRFIHDQITTDLTNYNAQLQDKALAGCINWETSTPLEIKVLHLNAYYTAVFSDAPIHMSKLTNSATLACNRLRKKHHSNCDCMPIDKNGKPALKVPDSFFEKVRAANVLTSENEQIEADAMARVGAAAYERGDRDQAIHQTTKASNTGDYDRAQRQRFDRETDQE